MSASSSEVLPSKEVHDNLELITMSHGIDTEFEKKPLTDRYRPWYKVPDQRRLFALGVLILLFAIMEFAVGVITGSLALLADASHMLSDQFAITIGFAAIQIKKREKSDRYSYGWERAEVIGALINGVFLFSASMFILLEAIERFIEPPTIKNPVLLISAAGAGLLVNLIGLLLFLGHRGGGHGHSHGHSHGGGHSHEKKEKKEKHSHSHGHDHKKPKDPNAKGEKKPKKHNVNMHGVFLHVLGDCLGSIAALASGLGMWLLPWKQRYYLDPICSVLITIIILKSSIPLIKTCMKILMQSVPDNVNLATIEDEVMALNGIVSVHELHIWQLADTKVIGTAHVACRSDVDFFTIAVDIKKILHKHGVHSSTIQPEFVPVEAKEESSCALACESGACSENMCCTPSRSRRSSRAPLVEKRKTGKQEIELP